MFNITNSNKLNQKDKNDLCWSALGRIKKIHFIGIGGVGMSGIAEVLHNQGYTVSGSDLKSSATLSRLAKIGLTCFVGHCASQVVDADVVVVSSAIDNENPEVKYALENRIPVIARGQMLGELMRFRYGIAISGTHGKTTTTSLVASIFAAANYDPTYVIGGKLNSLGANAKLGSGSYLITEADESDASFLHFNPMVSICTNIDNDHLSTYSNDIEVLKKTFLQFFNQCPFYGLVIACLDCPILKTLLSNIHCSVLTYGFDEKADVRAVDYVQNELVAEFRVVVAKKNIDAPIRLRLSGRHNVSNALSAIAVSLEEGIEMSVIQKALLDFSGVDRRMQVYGSWPLPAKSSSSSNTNNTTNIKPAYATLVDDYGHHPSELKAVFSAVRESWPNRKLVVVFQPHRYTRTHELFYDFADVLATVDALVLLEVFPAGEKPINGVNSKALAWNIHERGRIEPLVVSCQSQLKQVLHDVLNDNDILLMMGAGNVGQLASEFKLDCVSFAK